jgi:L-malate glycosyltransferase
MVTPLKILHIIKSLGRGGAETLLPETLKLHDKTQFEFHYIYFLPWKDQMAEEIRSQGGTVTCIAATNNIRIMRKWKTIRAYIRTHQIDLVHAHLPWAGFLSRLIHYKTGIPVLYTEHNKQERYHFATRFLNRMSFNTQSAAIAVSADVASSIRKNINPRIPVYEVLNGVNTDKYQRDRVSGAAIRKQLGVPEGATVVGTVAVFRFQKRLKEWLDVFARATANAPEVYGIIVGDGPLKAEILQHRKTLGLEEKVFMAGLQTQVIPWVSAMDIFMMTSVFEGLPIALLEAMSMECAVCSTDAGGIREVIRDKKDGVLVGVDDLTGMASRLNTLFREADRRVLASAARNRVIDQFSLASMVSHLEQLYGSYPAVSPSRNVDGMTA